MRSWKQISADGRECQPDRPRRRFYVIVLLVLGSVAGCGNKPAIYSNADVYLIRGHRDWYSLGIDQLGAKLTAERRETVVLPQALSGRLADALVTAPLRTKPLVLIGFSYGADDAIRVAHRLAGKGRTVDLLVTIDPVTPWRVPANVKRCVNYYQSNGVADVMPWLRGVPLQPEDDTLTSLTNFNLRGNRTDLLEPGTSHATIAGNRKMHVEIVNQTVGVVPAIATLSRGSKHE
jgi:pimeloyl-ACP methyl ester carboxylesterase